MTPEYAGVMTPEEELATDCYCGECDSACKYRPFKPCCGACMVGSPYDPSGEKFRAERLLVAS